MSDATKFQLDRLKVSLEALQKAVDLLELPNDVKLDLHSKLSMAADACHLLRRLHAEHTKTRARLVFPDRAVIHLLGRQLTPLTADWYSPIKLAGPYGRCWDHYTWTAKSTVKIYGWAIYVDDQPKVIKAFLPVTRLLSGESFSVSPQSD